MTDEWHLIPWFGLRVGDKVRRTSMGIGHVDGEITGLRRDPDPENNITFGEARLKTADYEQWQALSTLHEHWWRKEPYDGANEDLLVDTDAELRRLIRWMEEENERDP